MNYWVWVFGEIDGLRWVLEQRTMAFPQSATSRIRPMATGDYAILYTARSAYNNPTRDEARLFGAATVASQLERSEPPVEIAGREFPWLCRIEIDRVLPERTGPSVRALAPTLDVVRKPETWGAYFRQSPIRISEDDFERMRKAIESAAGKEEDA